MTPVTLPPVTVRQDQRALRIVWAGTPEAASLLKRIPLDELETDTAVSAQTAAVFGETLTPEQFVERVRSAVRERGDHALREISERLEGSVPERFETSRDDVREAYSRVPPQLVEDMRCAAERIEAFHRLQPKGS